MPHSVKSLQRHRRDWEDLGKVDPLWAVLSSPAYRHGRWDSEEFFATGDKEVAILMATCDGLGLPRTREVALDFGCGVGRVTRALANHFKRCIGLDISSFMIEQARERHRNEERCRFVLNTSDDLTTFESASADLIYTKYVLQHLPSRTMIWSYLREFLRVLRPEGLLVFQLPRRIPPLNRLQPRRRLYSLLRRLGVSERILLERLQLTPMRMRAIPEPQVRSFLEGLGGRVIRVERESEVEQIYFVTR